MSRQTLQPLIWLVRRWTRPRVRAGTPPFSRDFPRAKRACMASGTSIAGFFILACSGSRSWFRSLAGTRRADVTDERPDRALNIRYLSHRPVRVRHGHDETRPKDVTVDEHKELAEQFEAQRAHLRA